MTDSVVPTTGERWGTGARPAITYVPWTELWDGFEPRVADVVRSSGGVAVGELGGGANPTLGLQDRVGRPIDLTVLDISAEELDRSPAHLAKLCVDLCAEEPPVHERFDVVFSRMLCEHVTSGRAFHRNCYAALRPGGYAVHFFPAPTALPFALNRLLPRTLSERLLETFFPARKRGGKHGKFPARYSWCWGPTPKQLERYRSVGFEVVACDVGIGHGYYQHFPVLRSLERAKADFLLRHPTPWQAAFVLFVLRRPPE
jgi:SAM-dependent methyltransferase